jgi:ParB family transcriptional regulator, chromosome partitioning protein
MSKRGLGRGLDALLSQAPDRNEREGLVDVPVAEVHPNPLQPRKAFEPSALDELARSIKASGVIQPVIVRRITGGYQLIAGERRWRAARAAGLTQIPAIVREATDAQALELALVENLLREDLNPMEEAEAYQRLIAEFSWTQEELGGRVGRDRSSIANSLRLLRLPGEIQDDLRAGRLTMGHARAILALTEEREQLALRTEILQHSWSVRATEDKVQKRRAPRAARPGSPELRALEEAIQHALMTRVRITGGGRRGRIDIAYATADELERIAALLGARH